MWFFNRFLLLVLKVQQGQNKYPLPLLGVDCWAGACPDVISVGPKSGGDEGCCCGDVGSCGDEVGREAGVGVVG